MKQLTRMGLVGLVLAGCTAQEAGQEARKKEAAENRMSGQVLHFPSDCARVVSLGEKSYGQLGSTIQYVSCERVDGSYSLWEEDCAVAGRWTEIKRYRPNSTVGKNKEQ